MSKEKKTRNQRTNWSTADDSKLISTLATAKAAGLQSATGFKPTAWTQCEEALRGSEAVTGSGPKTKEACRTRYQKVSGSLL